MFKMTFPRFVLCAVIGYPAMSFADKPAATQLAEQTDTVAAAQSLASTLETYQSLSGHYRQTMSNKAGTVLQDIKGDFQLKRPGQYFWQSEDPYPQTIVSNGSQVWLYDPDLEQVTITETAKLGFNPSSFLSGDIRSELARYRIEVSGNQYTLYPTESGAPFDVLKLEFGNGLLEQASYVDKLGQTTALRFSGVVKNPELKTGVFEFDIPEGTDIVSNE